MWIDPGGAIERHNRVQSDRIVKINEKRIGNDVQQLIDSNRGPGTLEMTIIIKLHAKSQTRDPRERMSQGSLWKARTAHTRELSGTMGISFEDLKCFKIERRILSDKWEMTTCANRITRFGELVKSRPDVKAEHHQGWQRPQRGDIIVAVSFPDPTLEGCD